MASLWSRRPTGWRFGLWCATATTTIIFLVNLSALIYFATFKQDIGTIFEGDCNTVSRTSIGLHLLINILSSLLLAASNYTMQVLAAPTRAECDKAHSKGDWLDIGILSIRNIFKLRGRFILWFALLASSFPVHLLYNSVIFKTLSANYYHAMVVDDAFLRGSPVILARGPPQAYLDRQQSWLVNGSRFDNLTTSDCITALAVDYVDSYHNFLMVTTSKNDSIGHAYFNNGPDTIVDPISNDPLDISIRSPYATYEWLCPSTRPKCTPSSLQSSNFTVDGENIAYCLAEKTPGHCQVQFSLSLLITVVVCNLVKVLAMLATLRQKVPTLVVLGDAVASFLEKPAAKQKRPTPSIKRRRWIVAPTAGQWIIFVIVCMITIGTTGKLFGDAINGAQGTHSRQSALSIPFGVSVPATIITSLFQGHTDTQATIISILVANIPQLAMSTAYLLFNNLFTTMLLSHEWSGFTTAQHLRVSSPVGSQRSTYWLQLPLVYGLPLLVISAVMHWLISQALFLVRLQTRRLGFISNNWLTSKYNSTVTIWPPMPENSTSLASVSDEVFYPNSTTTSSYYRDEIVATRSVLAYSPVAILIILAIGMILFLGIFVLALIRKFKSNMPLAPPSSIVIAAACQPPGDHADATKAIKWAELPEASEAEPAHSLMAVVDTTDVAGQVDEHQEKHQSVITVRETV